MRAYIVLLIMFFLLINNYSRSQDKIKDYDGIPIITYGYNIYNPHTFGNYNFSKMTDAGIFALEVVDIDSTMYSDILSNTSLNIIPDQVGNNVLNYINYYTYGRYSKWEAEGTPESEGAATLSNNVAHTTESDGSVITNINNIPNGTILISGPKYAQEVTYSYEHLPILYNANFRLKLENIGSPLPQPTDVICTLRVYCAKWEVINNTYWQIVNDYYYDKVLRYYEFTGGWENEILSYNLEDAYNHFLTDPMPESMYRISKKNDSYVEYKFIEHVEFQVIWQGDESKVKLYIDNVTLYDDRGLTLIDDFATSNIISQVNELTNFKTKTAGWLSADEPYVIDNYAPIKKVNEIIDNIPNNSAHLWIAFAGHWSGTYGDPGNLNLYLNQVYQIDEFMKRVKKANIWMNCYMFNDPYDINFNPWPGGDYRIRNINRIGELLYKKCNDANLHAGVDLYWGASVQTGKYYIYQEQPEYIKTNYVEITSQQFLYTTNLALLYGAKLISPWLYFGFIDDPTGNDLWDYTGLANEQDQYQENYKYFTLRDTISPRLKGLMGKTLKKLNPINQYAGSNGISYSTIAWDYNPNGYGYIEDITPSDSTYSLDEYGIDMGFFNDSLSSDKIYFMVLNRHYSSKSKYSIKLKDLNYYSNWHLINYVDTTSTTLLAANNKTIFLDTLLTGDANLYSIAAVVKYGGLLAYNDTIKVDTTLSDNMTIDAGKVLQINEGKTYTITDTITFTDTSSFITGYGYINRIQNGWIITRNWNKSLFKGRSGSHPKLIWSKHPDITNVINYNIYRNHANSGWQYLTTKSSSTFEYLDSTITIIEGMTQANETSTHYRITVTHRPTRDLVETSPSNTILYHRVEGHGLEKQNYGLTSDDFTYNLDQNYPNPFNPTTTISYSIADDGIVTLEIMNILGERIKTLVNEFETKGNHNISFNASSLASGVYIYKIQSGDFISSKKMILLK